MPKQEIEFVVKLLRDFGFAVFVAVYFLVRIRPAFERFSRRLTSLERRIDRRLAGAQSLRKLIVHLSDQIVALSKQIAKLATKK